jgi:hypothetical protein
VLRYRLLPLDNAVRIRTAETNAAALQDRTSVRSESHQSNRIIPPITGAFSETMGSSKWVPTTELRIETVVHGEVVGR